MITTALRLIDLLRAVPNRQPGATAQELAAVLASEGWKVHLRTVQRDLQDLSVKYPLVSRGKPLRWCWAESARALQMPGLDPTGATVWTLVERHLRPLLPPVLLRELEPQFKAASEVLKTAGGGRTAWPKRIAAISSAYPLIPPRIDPEVYEHVADCLTQARCFEATYVARYETRGKRFEVNPLGFVLRDQTLYLVATLWQYDTPVQLALHRMTAIVRLDRVARSPAGFDLARYAAGPQVRYPVGTTLKLRLQFIEEAGFHLTEAALSPDQRIRQTKEGTYIVTATVDDTLQLRWWLLGFGAQVEVLKPVALRREMAAHANGMSTLYR